MLESNRKYREHNFISVTRALQVRKRRFQNGFKAANISHHSCAWQMHGNE